jgi:hypothetical protein
MVAGKAKVIWDTFNAAADRSCTLRKEVIFEMASKRGRQTSLNSFKISGGGTF